MVLSAFVSNTAIAVVMTPIALSISETFMVDPRPFLIAVCFGASASFMTPMGYQTNLMVFGPGQYQFKDFIHSIKLNQDTKVTFKDGRNALILANAANESLNKGQNIRINYD